ncbi:PucR family transcriptional regulator [Patulibacter defluvii]|uniref:PucR family transcriptional regulator n=1 Tax=Patulibacter defluvii TaxID=3095358 RepID=UPI002A7518C0|nr:helix-turn-helix domain-containing protein [Patulibacter sp. DM4]
MAGRQQTRAREDRALTAAGSPDGAGGTALMVGSGAEVARSVASDLAERIEQLGTAMSDLMRREIPEIRERSAPVEMQTCCSSHLEEVSRLLQSGTGADGMVMPEPAIDLVRGFARRKVPLETVLRKYRVGHAFVWDTTSRALRENLYDDPERLFPTLDTVSRFLFDYIDHGSTAVAATYREEFEQWTRSASAVRAETAYAILEGTVHNQREASARLGYDLDAHHVGIVVDAVDPDVTTTKLLERQALTAASRIGCAGPLIVAGGPTTVWAWCALPSIGPRELVERIGDARSHNGVRTAVGRPARGIEGFRVSHEEAREAARFAPSGGSVTAYSAVELVSLLASDLDRARRFVSGRLGPLAIDEPSAAELRHTLRAFFVHGASYKHAAGALNMHHNTVYMRIRRITSLVGETMMDRRVELESALMLVDALGPELLEPAA